MDSRKLHDFSGKVIIFMAGFLTGAWLVHRLCQKSAEKDEDSDMMTDDIEFIDDFEDLSDVGYWDKSLAMYRDKIMSFSEQAYTFLIDEYSKKVPLTSIRREVSELFCNYINECKDPDSIKFETVINYLLEIY